MNNKTNTQIKENPNLIKSKLDLRLSNLSDKDVGFKKRKGKLKINLPQSYKFHRKMSMVDSRKANSNKEIRKEVRYRIY